MSNNEQAHTSASQSDDIVPYAFIGPAVFQCAKCLQILTDSVEAIALCKSLQLLAVKGVTGATIKEGLREEEQPFHSVSAAIACNNCSDIVGHKFQELPLSHDTLKGLFCLSINKISSYRLGDSDLRAEESSGAEHCPDLDGQGDMADGQGTQQDADFAGQGNLVQRFAQLEVDMVDVQKMLLLHNEQIAQLQDELRVKQ